MSSKYLSLVAGLVGLLMATPMASAGDMLASGRGDTDAVRVWKPYVVEKNCTDDFDHCTVRMDYAPFERAMVARPGSYWYQKPFQVHRYGDFEPRHRHHHMASSSSRHVAWCSERYRTYDPATDMFVGKGYRHYHCDSPYDGR